MARASCRRKPLRSRGSPARSAPSPAPIGTTMRAAFIAASAAIRRCSTRKRNSSSGTGWPSFWQPIAKTNVEEKRRPQLRLHAHGGIVPPLRRASWPCLRRWPEADGPALLHEFGRAALRRARRAGLTEGDAAMMTASDHLARGARFREIAQRAAMPPCPWPSPWPAFRLRRRRRRRIRQTRPGAGVRARPGGGAGDHRRLGRLLLGRPGRFPACERRRIGSLRLRRRRGRYGAV